MKQLILFLFLLISSGLMAQEDSIKMYKAPATGHEIELLGGYNYYAPGYRAANGEWMGMVVNKHVFRYGVGYTYRWKRLRHQFYLSSYSVNYNFERRKSESFGWVDHNGEVQQQWLEFGGFGAFKIFDSTNVRLYPCLGFSFGFPIAGKNAGSRSEGVYSTTEEYLPYNYDKAPSKILTIQLGLMYNWELTEKIGFNTYLFYSRSLIHPDLLGDDNRSLGKLQMNQLLFKLGFYYFISKHDK